MRRIQVLLACIGIVLGACQHAPKTPVQRWKVSPYGKVPIQSMYPVYFEDGVLVSQVLSDSIICFTMLATQDGYVRWQCNDTATVHGSFYNYLTTAQLGELLYLPNGPILLALDLRQGHIAWKTQLPLSGEDHVVSDGVHLYRTYMQPDFSKSIVYQIDPLSGQHTAVDSMVFGAGNRGFARTPVCMDDLLAYTYIVQQDSTKQGYSGIRCYDLRTRQPLLQDTIYPANKMGYGVNKQPVYDHEEQCLFLAANDQLIRYDLLTRRIAWRQSMQRDMLTSVPLLYEGFIYWAGEDGKLYQVNVANGQIGWVANISGTPSRLFVKDNLIHLVGGGNGKWLIHRISDGQPVYQIKTPHIENYPDLYFLRGIGVHPDYPIALLHDYRSFVMYDLR
jgi:outer membrane protein assembly factor BamB